VEPFGTMITVYSPAAFDQVMRTWLSTAIIALHRSWPKRC